MDSLPGEVLSRMKPDGLVLPVIFCVRSILQQTNRTKKEKKKARETMAGDIVG